MTIISHTARYAWDIRHGCIDYSIYRRYDSVLLAMHTRSRPQWRRLIYFWRRYCHSAVNFNTHVLECRITTRYYTKISIIIYIYSSLLFIIILRCQFESVMMRMLIQLCKLMHLFYMQNTAIRHV